MAAGARLRSRSFSTGRCCWRWISDRARTGTAAQGLLGRIRLLRAVDLVVAGLVLVGPTWIAQRFNLQIGPAALVLVLSAGWRRSGSNRPGKASASPPVCPVRIFHRPADGQLRLRLIPGCDCVRVASLRGRRDGAGRTDAGGAVDLYAWGYRARRRARGPARSWRCAED